MNKDRLITVIILLGALVFAAALPNQFSLAHFGVAAIVIIAGVIWLLRR